MGMGLSSLVIHWHTFDLSVNLYGNKHNKKAKSNNSIHLKSSTLYPICSRIE